MTFTSHSVDETLALGRCLGALCAPGMCIALDGPLGAGKTHLTRGIAEGAGVADVTLVSSPTYVLLNIYPAGGTGAKPVFHLDAYRIATAEDFAAVGLDELLTACGLVVIEWAEKIADLLPADHLRIAIEHAGELEDHQRIFTIEGTGPHARETVGRLLLQSVWT